MCQSIYMPYLTESLNPEVGTIVPHLQVIRNKSSEGLYNSLKDPQLVNGNT